MNHITVAVSKQAFEDLFHALRDSIHVEESGSITLGRLTAGYSIGINLEDGSIQLNNNNSVSIRELDINWGASHLYLGFDLPTWPLFGWTIWDDNPDINITMDLDAIITSEISITVEPRVIYYTDPNRTSGMTDLAAEDAGIPNKWQVFLHIRTVDADVFDIASSVGNYLEALVSFAINNILWFLPDWAKDFIWSCIGPVIQFIEFILDIGDDIVEWLANLLGVSLGLGNLILQAVLNKLANENPLIQFEDAFPILKEATVFNPVLSVSQYLIPVKIPIRNFDATINSDEMVLLANVGA